MSGFALVFPGQGAQFAGMGKALYREFGRAREIFEEASDATHLDLAALCFEDHADQLALTEFTQPCVLTASLAAWRVLCQETGLKPGIAAGHSLGEYSALAAAGVLTVGDAAQAVRLRGKWMQEAVPAGMGGMAAVMSTPREVIEQACREAAQGQVVAPANDNAPDQIVISGHTEAVDRAIAALKAKGSRAKKLKVSGPFHTELMAPAAGQMARLLSGLSFSPLAFPVIANVDAEPYPGPEAVADRLVRQITQPVKWRETVEAMDRRGIRIYLEAGPGNVLAGLIKRTAPSAVILPLLEPQDIPAIAKAAPT